MSTQLERAVNILVTSNRQRQVQRSDDDKSAVQQAKSCIIQYCLENKQDHIPLPQYGLYITFHVVQKKPPINSDMIRSCYELYHQNNEVDTASFMQFLDNYRAQKQINKYDIKVTSNPPRIVSVQKLFANGTV